MSEKKKRGRPDSAAPTDPELSEKIAATLAGLGDFHDPLVVIGDGWAAMAAAGFAASGPDARNVLWIRNSGARALCPLPMLEAGPAAAAWAALASRLGIPLEEARAGQFLREYRNRSFARPAWHKTPTRELRAEAIAECVWAPEARIAPVFEARFDLPLGELEERIRAKLAGLPNVRSLAGVPITGFEFADAAAGGSADRSQVVLATGARIPFANAVWADRWIGLSAVEGMPKNTGLARNREPVGILQAVFTHSAAIVSQSVQEAFHAVAHKDSGDAFTRSVWGYFFDGGRKSVWTLFLTEEEGVDNHLIARKYRRLRQAVDKMFQGPEWLPEGKTEFLATVADEQLLYQEDFLFAGGEAPLEPQYLPAGGKTARRGSSEALPIAFITDAFGPSIALQQAAALFEMAAPVAEPSAPFEESRAEAEG